MKRDELPRVGDVVISVEWPSGRVELVPWTDYMAANLYATAKQFTRWAARMWWKAFLRRVRRQPVLPTQTVAEWIRR